MKKMLFVFGLSFLGLGIILHFYFLNLDTQYVETFSNQIDCKIILSQISNNLNESLEKNCPTQIYLLQFAFIKLLLGLGIFLTVAGSFLAYSRMDKK